MDEFLTKYPKYRQFTEFEQKVYFATWQIPSGTVVSYKDVAERIGHPNSYRAVGNALSKNPYIGEVPCHRVIKGDGTIGGFGEELALKYQLLAREGIYFGPDGKVTKRKPS